MASSSRPSPRGAFPSEPEAAAPGPAAGDALDLLEQILNALRAGDIRTLGKLTTKNFRGPLQTIIPWATNHFTETLIARVSEKFGDDFWGFWMLGGMSGGGMGFIVEPSRKAEALEAIHEIMIRTKRELENALPFASYN